MLSNPTNGLHARHRRQTSTPNAYEGMKVPSLPNQGPVNSHRRGLSLDTRRQYSASPRQDLTVSTNTNTTGLANASQHALREAQPQRIQARPGSQQHPYSSLAPSASDTYIISPHGTPSSQRFDPSCFDPSNVPFDPYGSELNAMMQKSQAAYGSKEFDIFNPDSALSTPTFLNFHESPSSSGWISEGDTASTRRSSRRISNGIMDRVSKFENLGFEGMQRPITPPNSNAQGYFPPTPIDTPHDRLIKHEPRSNRFAEGYDESMEETIKACRNRSNQRAQTIFQDMRRSSVQSDAVPSPRSGILPSTESFGGMPLQSPDYLNMNSFNNEFLKIEDSFDRDLSEPHSLDMSQHAPATPQMAQFMQFGPHSLTGTPSQTPSRRHSPHRRTESLASIASAASIASINIEETKTDTGVTIEEISQYIQGPDTADGKWMCLFEDCGKKFGRKENIKSHVQTHLNDRQYQCPTCKKCFVRQHDLKRHAKIHTGIKPYPCECGNSFARHDALTRHRQRGMCIGAFDGVVRKVVKRGRPKKNRPDMETRVEKSSRQRRKNMSVSSASSQSGYSDSSAVNSPEQDYNMLDDMMGIGLNPHTADMASASSAPMISLRGPAMSAASSPPAMSPHSYVSPEAIMERTPSHVASPAKSVGSHYNPSPALSAASSPAPAPFFESEAGPGSTAMNSIATTSAMLSTASLPATMSLGITDQADDILLQFTEVDRDPNMLMMSKFDEEFDNAMFNNTDDVFFGST